LSTGGAPRDTDGPYLLDTHIWFWYLLESERLPAGLRSALDEKLGDLWLSPISVWELAMLAKRGRVRLANGSRTWVEEALHRVPVHEASLTREVALASIEIDLPHRDPADRFLAATALVHELTLVTVDVRLSAASWLATRSA
jgi:PIN domain nuclease of toxin-antitoxin system